MLYHRNVFGTYTCNNINIIVSIDWCLQSVEHWLQAVCVPLTGSLIAWIKTLWLYGLLHRRRNSNVGRNIYHPEIERIDSTSITKRVLNHFKVSLTLSNVFDHILFVSEVIYDVARLSFIKRKPLTIAASKWVTPVATAQLVCNRVCIRFSEVSKTTCTHILLMLLRLLFIMLKRVCIHVFN